MNMTFPICLLLVYLSEQDNQPAVQISALIAADYGKFYLGREDTKSLTDDLFPVDASNSQATSFDTWLYSIDNPPFPLPHSSPPYTFIFPRLNPPALYTYQLIVVYNQLMIYHLRDAISIIAVS